MTQERKQRGRPKGSEIDDSTVLAAIADMLTANPKMRATTAMRRIKREVSDAEIHRWQDKWKQRKVSLLADAAVRAEAEKRRESERQSASRSSGVDILKFADKVSDNPLVRLAKELEDNPIRRMARDLENNPITRLARELENNPITRLAREMENNPLVRLAREMEANPALKMLQEQRRYIDTLYGGFKF